MRGCAAAPGAGPRSRAAALDARLVDFLRRRRGDRYKEIARGQILGDVTGLLKLIFHAETRELLGVHIIGEGTSELIHIGQAVLSFGGKIDYFIDTVFNYPPLAECYKVAAFDGVNRLGI